MTPGAYEGEPLTPLENNVLRPFGSVLSIQAIAERLGLDRDEVLCVKSRAMEKAGLTTRLNVLNYVRGQRDRGADS